MSGAAELAGTFQLITKSAETFAKAATTTTGFFGKLFTPLVLGMTAVVVALMAFKAAFDLMTTSLHAFSEESKKLFETGVVLKNLGSSLTLPEVRRFADEVSRRTGINRPEIEGTVGVLARTGIGGNQIEKTLKTIGDTARATGSSFAAIGEAVEGGILGKMRGMKEFGITLEDTGSRAANLQLILQQLNLRFQGGAEAYRQTLPGSIDAMAAALQRFLSALGEQFAPAAIRIFNFLADALDVFADRARQVADTLALLLGGPVGVVLLHAAQAADAGKNPMAGVGRGGDPATESTLLQVADNTKQMADSVIQQVLGGQGVIAEQAFGFMSARLAMAI